MYFKSISLQGFKSFADKTVLDFKGGITAIVGPNGSGKSNISDAIRWVMGEMSAKSLRGSKMEDVIFCGSERRKPLGFAEVTITMDNSDKSMKLDFDEVSVTRRVYRSGESEYYINKSPCRLKDIHELFMDTGLGRDGYSIIGQGKIDAILSAKSDERRHVFDEAAGISKFRYRKLEAEKKLETTNDNLVRVTDIINELESQIEPLRKQSEKAREYLVLKDTLKKSEINLWLSDIDKSKTVLESVKRDHDIVADNIASLGKSITDTEEKISSLKEKNRLNDSDIDRLRADIYRKREEITKSESEAEIIKSTLEHSKGDSLRISGEIKLLEERIETLSKTLEEKLSQKILLESSHAKEEEKVSACHDDLNKIIEEIKAVRLGADKQGEHSKELSDKLLELNSRAAANKQLISSETDHIANLMDQLSSAEKKYSEKEEIYRELEEKTNRLSKRIDSLQKALDDAKAESEESAKALNSYTAQTTTLENNLKTLKDRKKLLEDLESGFDGFGGSVKLVMKAHQSGELGSFDIFAPVSSLIETDSKYVSAVEAALGAATNHIVTSEEKDAKAAISYLKQTKGGRATFLPISAMKPKPFAEKDVSSSKGYIGMAADLVNYDKKFSRVMEYLLGRTVVADNIDNAVDIAKKYSYSFKIVTLHGDVLNAGGSISGGSQSKAGSLSRRDEIENISEKIVSLEKKLKSQLALHDEYLSKSEEAKAALDAKNRLLWDSKREMAEHSATLRHSKEAMADALSLLNNLKSDLATSEKIKEDALLFEKTSEEEISRLTGLISKVATDRGGAESVIASLQENYTILTERLNVLTAQSVSSGKDLQICISSIEEISGEISATKVQIEEKEKLVSDSLSGADRLKEEIETLKAKSESLKTEIVSDEENLAKLSDLKVSSNNDIDAAEALLKQHNETAFKLRGEEGRLSAKLVKLESDNENILSRLWEEYELTYSTALPFRDESLDYGELSKEVAALKNKIKSMGNINVNAIEDYKITKERYEFLNSQRQDILAAKAQIEELIDEMVRVMSEMFEKNFAALNKAFSETFRDLFGGGKASLSLSTPDDILESGVEIEVQPPGKNLQNITLLSGGEKAFTAIALIFAILKISPTHFCIFDEIEAALDDVNVFRFADFLRKLSSRTQFIVITHRKGTMESADTLYGVTMQEKGITQLLSLELDNI